MFKCLSQQYGPLVQKPELYSAIFFLSATIGLLFLRSSKMKKNPNDKYIHFVLLMFMLLLLSIVSLKSLLLD